jgi:hypothetical protein
MKISDIARRVTRQRTRRPRVRTALEDILPPAPAVRPPPRRLYPGPAPVIDLAQARAQRAQRRHRQPAASKSRLTLVLALLGAAALGAVVTHFYMPGSFLRYDDGMLLARGGLATALGGQLTGQAPAGEHVLLTATYRSKGGGICRNFSIASSRVLSGTACREQRQWRIRSLGSDGSSSLLAATGRGTAIVSLSNAAEVQLRAHDWQ